MIALLAKDIDTNKIQFGLLVKKLLLDKNESDRHLPYPLA
jgi:hypothetical protein